MDQVSNAINKSQIDRKAHLASQFADNNETVYSNMRNKLSSNLEKGLIDEDLYNSSLTTIDELEKGGEGSKGGKVIGHTKSGKPIYRTDSSTNWDHPEHKDFTAKDHKDAQNLIQAEHDKKSDSDEPDNDELNDLWNESGHHKNMFNKKTRDSKKKE